MILPGLVIVSRNIIRNLKNAAIQTQPCGIDLTLKRILVWKGSGTVDFDNSQRQNAATTPLPFQTDPTTSLIPGSKFLHLPAGSYLVEFNETVDVPLDVMGQIFVRSSLFRSGAVLHAGVMDAGYKGGVGALLQVVNRDGIRLWQYARLAQMVFHQMSEPTEGYQGVYQGRQEL